MTDEHLKSWRELVEVEANSDVRAGTAWVTGPTCISHLETGSMVIINGALYEVITDRNGEASLSMRQPQWEGSHNEILQAG